MAKRLAKDINITIHANGFQLVVSDSDFDTLQNKVFGSREDLLEEITSIITSLPANV